MIKYIYMLLISIVLQIGGYFYLDRVMLIPAASISQQTIIDEAKLPANPDHVSYDRKYIVELKTQSVTFYAASGKIAEIPFQAEDSVTYFSWVPETHLALIGISRCLADYTILSLKCYDLDSCSVMLEQQISDLPSGSQIVSAAYSTVYNVTYVLIKGSAASCIYRTENNNLPTKVFAGFQVSRMALLQGQDTLLFDNNNQDTAAVYMLDKKGKQKVISPQDGQYALIGTDRDDHIYIGQLTSTGVTSSILRGTVGGGFTEIQALENPYPAASVTVNYDGKLLYN